MQKEAKFTLRFKLDMMMLKGVIVYSTLFQNTLLFLLDIFCKQVLLICQIIVFLKAKFKHFKSYFLKNKVLSSCFTITQLLNSMLINPIPNSLVSLLIPSDFGEAAFGIFITSEFSFCATLFIFKAIVCGNLSLLV